MGHWSLRVGTFGTLFQQLLEGDDSDIIKYFGSVLVQL